MKKFLTSFVFILAFASYGLYSAFVNSNTVLYVAPQNAPSTQSVSVGTTNFPAAPTVSAPAPVSVPKPISRPAPINPVAIPTPTPVIVPKQQGQYIDGTYTGSVADAYYGNVQVQVTISGGKITDVEFLQYPNDRSTSRYINSQAMPALKTETIQSQSAQVDIFSGATDTSGAFRQSLASALTQAKA